MVGTQDPPLPVDDLSRLLTDLETLLDAVVAAPAGLVPPYMETNLEAAWGSVKPLFEEARQALTGIMDADFAQVGLAGPELEFKVNAAMSASDLARRAMAQVGQLARAAPAALATALGLADVILKSLPPPVSLLAERIGEFKSIVEHGALAVAFVVE